MSRKQKNRIDIKNSLALFREGYGLQTIEFNYYQFRVRHEEVPDIFYDWYHTTGSLVRTTNKYPKSLGVIKNPESVAILIKKEMTEKIK